jgi:hypothetical protein
MGSIPEWKKIHKAGHRRLTPEIPATREAEIRRIEVHQTLSRKTLHRRGLVEWLEAEALSSNPSTEKKKY